MKANGKVMMIGLAGFGLGVAGVLACGIGIAQAAAPTSPSTQSATAPAWGPGGMHGHGSGACLTAAAQYLGMSDADLRAQLQEGKTLAQVAQDKGKSVDGLKAAMLAAAESHLDTVTTLTDEEKAARLAQMETRFDTMVDQVHTPGDGRHAGLGTGTAASTDG